MCIGIKGTTPGVGWGKELSLSVEEWSSPISHKAWVDADTPHPVTYAVLLHMAAGGVQELWVLVVGSLKLQVNLG